MGYTAIKPFDSMWDGVDDAFEDAAERAANLWSRWAANRAAELSPVATIQGLSPSQVAGARGRAPGTFKNSWKRDRANRLGRRVLAGFYSDDLVAGWIEYGTRPHIIRPRPDRRPASVLATGKPRATGERARLRFYVNGRPVYAKLVHHPGTKGQFIVHRVIQESGPIVEALLGEHLAINLRRAMT